MRVAYGEWSTGRPSTEPDQWAILRERLRWCHGEERTREIMSGNDAATRADQQAWRNLGRRGR